MLELLVANKYIYCCSREGNQTDYSLIDSDQLPNPMMYFRATTMGINEALGTQGK